MLKKYVVMMTVFNDHDFSECWETCLVKVFDTKETAMEYCHGRQKDVLERVIDVMENVFHNPIVRKGYIPENVKDPEDVKTLKYFQIRYDLNSIIPNCATYTVREVSYEGS